MFLTLKNREIKSLIHPFAKDTTQHCNNQPWYITWWERCPAVYVPVSRAPSPWSLIPSSSRCAGAAGTCVSPVCTLPRCWMNGGVWANCRRQLRSPAPANRATEECYSGQIQILKDELTWNSFLIIKAVLEVLLSILRSFFSSLNATVVLHSQSLLFTHIYLAAV